MKFYYKPFNEQKLAGVWSLWQFLLEVSVEMHFYSLIVHHGLLKCLEMHDPGTKPLVFFATICRPCRSKENSQALFKGDHGPQGNN